MYVGTGEANASGDSAAGAGLYKSTDAGDTWTGPLGVAAFNGRAIGSIAVEPGDANTIYAATTRGVLGVSSVSGGAVSLIPGAAAWGLYKSTDGGVNWTFIHNGAASAAACDTVAEAIAAGSPCSLRGVRRVAIDPSAPDTIYAGSYSRGIWRSNDAGATWTQIKPSVANTRPMQTCGRSSPSRRLRTATPACTCTRDPVPVASPIHHRLRRRPSPRPACCGVTMSPAGTPVVLESDQQQPADPGYGTYDLCTGQCWYDELVYTPAGHPDIVYVGGSYQIR